MSTQLLDQRIQIGGNVFRLEMNFISRNGGSKARFGGDTQVVHSATAAAAYRTGSRIADYRTGVVHDYRRKVGVVHSEIVAPCDAPEWAASREHLWNSAESMERRKDARVANEFILCLPYGLGRESHISMLREFAEAIVLAHGIVVEFSVHRDDRRRWDGSLKDGSGFHAHMMLSTRPLTMSGFSPAKSREFQDRTLGPITLRRWRQTWAELGNKYLSVAGLRERWDHRSLSERRSEALSHSNVSLAMELNRLPIVHLGASATALERMGFRTSIGDHNRAIEIENERRHVAGNSVSVNCIVNDTGAQWPNFWEACVEVCQTRFKVSNGILRRAMPLLKEQFEVVKLEVEAGKISWSEWIDELGKRLSELEVKAVIPSKELSTVGGDSSSDMGIE